MSTFDPRAAVPEDDGADDTLGTCDFQFWVDRIESFYCHLDKCSWQSNENYGECVIWLVLVLLEDEKVAKVWLTRYGRFQLYQLPMRDHKMLLYPWPFLVWRRW